jgi:hypothetical protein
LSIHFFLSFTHLLTCALTPKHPPIYPFHSKPGRRVV